MKRQRISLLWFFCPPDSKRIDSLLSFSRQASIGRHLLQMPGGPRNPPATGVDKWTWGGHVNIARGKQSEEAGGGGATAVITPRAVLWILMLLTFG